MWIKVKSILDFCKSGNTKKEVLIETPKGDKTLNMEQSKKLEETESNTILERKEEPLTDKKSNEKPENTVLGKE